MCELCWDFASDVCLGLYGTENICLELITSVGSLVHPVAVLWERDVR